MLSGKGFNKLYNMSGGIKGWQSEVAIGDADRGLELFDGALTTEDALIIGFGLETGLRDFYLSMIETVTSEEAKKMFTMLADIEILHQDRIVELYTEVSEKPISKEEFLAKEVLPAMEGGLSVEEYTSRFQPDMENEIDILSLALSIEAQALDLYSRAAQNATKPGVAEIFLTIASEERTHINHLTDYISRIS
ncbi:MAG: hypothetical protein D6B25_14135 [Desulfobulbaceae bacterium]|nr:MAG: hypothetical protein D6B25_14135 [Desulfobulbaceae bacterium]